MAKSKKQRQISYEEMTKDMITDLNLDEKQAEKVAKLNKKYRTLIEGDRNSAGMNGRQPPRGQGGHGGVPNGMGQGGRGGGPGGMGGMGQGGPGGMGGGMGQGGSGGMGGGMGQGGRGGGPGGMGGMGMSSSRAESEYDYDKNQEKYDKKLRKILTEEQYESYKNIRPRFASQRLVREFLLGGQGMGPGNGQGGPGMGMPPGGHHGKTSGTLSATGVGLTQGEQTVTTQSYTSQGVDENAVQVSGGTLCMNDCLVEKSGGDSEDGDGTSFYGVNSAIVATNGGQVLIQGGTVTTQAVGANGIVAYGGKVNVKDVTIRCGKNLSRGIHATGGGEITAENLNVETAGNNSSVIATDRGGGTVTVNGGTYKASGQDCAVCYSTGVITVNGITGLSEKGEVGVIEGDNEININDCHMTSGDNRRGMMILQSGSGDAEGYNGRINVNGGSIVLSSSEAPLIEITTSTKGTVTLKDVALTVPSGVLMKVDYNKRWKTTSPVAFLNLETEGSAAYDGDVEVDEYGTSTVTVGRNVTWNGAYDKADTGKMTTVIVEGTWVLTDDSHVDKVMVRNGGVINKNGHTLVTSDAVGE